MNKNTIKVLSLFSGCGGLDLGFEQVGDYKTDGQMTLSMKPVSLLEIILVI